LEAFLGLLDSTEEHPRSKLRRYVITAIVFLAFIAGSIWWALRYHHEKVTARNFLNAVAAGKMDEAYRIWQPSPSYTFKDFLDDWGPDGYYGPIHSFHYEDAQSLPHGGSGVIIVVEVSPYSPFPDRDDAVKQSKTKEIRIVVEFNNQSISFPP
jgi:hypothetical protein